MEQGFFWVSSYSYRMQCNSRQWLHTIPLIHLVKPRLKNRVQLSVESAWIICCPTWLTLYRCECIVSAGSCWCWIPWKLTLILLFSLYCPEWRRTPLNDSLCLFSWALKHSPRSLHSALSKAALSGPTHDHDQCYYQTRELTLFTKINCIVKCVCVCLCCFIHSDLHGLCSPRCRCSWTWCWSDAQAKVFIYLL